MWFEPIPSRIFTSTGKRRSSGSSSGAKVRGEGMPRASRKRAISSLSTVWRVGVGSGMKTSAPSARKRWRVSARTIRSNSEQRHDAADVVALGELQQPVGVGRVGRDRHALEAVAEVGRRRELLHVGADHDAALAAALDRVAERLHDVDPQADAGQQHVHAAAFPEGPSQPPAAPL